MRKAAISPARRNVSAFDRLRKLPALFRGSDLTVRLQWDSKKTSHYLWLWKRRNLVRPLGGHSDVFANLVVDARPNWEAALLLARPSAVIVGVECLRRAGWTTQIPHRPEVAVDASLPMISTEHFDVERRPDAWFAAIAPGLIEDDTASIDPASRSAPSLRPAWALVDLLARADRNACALAPDDIDWSMVTPREREDRVAAEAALGVVPGR